MKLPTPTTLKKYGMSESDFVSLYASQQGRCAICGNIPTTGRYNIDHQHGIRGWKKLPPEQRKATVRGLLCWTCNRLIVGRGVTVARLESALQYLKSYQAISQAGVCSGSPTLAKSSRTTKRQRK